MDNSSAEGQHLMLEAKHGPHGISGPLPSSKRNHNIPVQLNTATNEAAGKAHSCACVVPIASCCCFCLWYCLGFHLLVWERRGEVTFSFKSNPFT